MNQNAALATLNNALGITGGLNLALASILIAASILWLSWIVLSQISRLRAGDITIENALGESLRSLLTVLAVIAIVAYLS